MSSFLIYTELRKNQFVGWLVGGWKPELFLLVEGDSENLG